MAVLFDPRFQAVDASGKPYSGAKLAFYRAGTSTLVTVYQNATGSTPHTNPVTADTAGVFPAIYLDTIYPLKAILRTAAGVTLQTIERFDPAPGGVTGNSYTVEAAADLPVPSNEFAEGRVLDDPDPAKNGRWYRDAGVWAFGRQFEAGPPGADGEPGPYTEITFGPVATGEPGTQVIMNQTPTEAGVNVDFTIPAGRGATPKGTYNPATAYVLDDAVLDNGSTWIALQATTGNAPPVLPATSNAHWQLLARRGVDGAGAVASIVAGPGVSIDNADPANPVISGEIVNETVTDAKVAPGSKLANRLADLPSLRDFGAKGDGTTVDNSAIQAAIDSGKAIFCPPGTYLLSLSQSINLEGGPSISALIAKSGMNLYGVEGKTIFKIRDNESTDASPKYFNLISGNTAISGLRLHGITFDLNGQNNKISPGRGSGVYNQFNCAGLMISGSVATVGVDARLSDAKITSCSFINSPGVTCIALGQSNQVGTILGRDIEIAHCRFYNNGLDCNDHSSVYMWANDVRLHHCTFDHPTMSSGIRGPISPAELHGSNNSFDSNTVSNYLWGPYVAGNLTSVSRGQFVSENTFFVAQKMVAGFVETASEPGLADIQITGNRVWLTQDFLHPGGEAKAAIDLTFSQGAVDGVIVSGNQLFTTDAYGAVAIRAAVLASGRQIKNIVVQGNQIRGFGTPIAIGRAGGGSIDGAVIAGNQLSDIKRNTTTATVTVGINIVGSNGFVSVSDNAASGHSGEPLSRGLNTEGTMVQFHADGNAFSQDCVTPLSLGAVVSGRRTGRDALRFTALPTNGTWKIGDFAQLGVIALLGTTPNKYVVNGWYRITNGSSNVLNTDWVENRSGSTGL